MLSGHRSRTSKTNEHRLTHARIHPATATKNCRELAISTSAPRVTNGPSTVALIMNDR